MKTIRSSTAYQHVADSVRRHILSGKLGPGEQLPTERELCEQFAASRITIRRALQILADELLIERRQGLGTFVSPSPSRRIPLLNSDFSGSLAAHAPDLDRALLSHGWQPASAEIAATLQLFPAASILFARRVDMLHGEAVAFDEVYLPEPVADRLREEDLAQLGFLERWQAVQQIRLGHLSQSIEAGAASPEQATVLNIAAGAPLLKEVDVFFLSSGAPCGVFISYYRHDLFQLTSTVRLSIDPQESPA
jgi:GntR family transcriptional regulator